MIYNRRQMLNLTQIALQMDKDDTKSVFRLVHEWTNNPDFDSPIRYYKPCGEINDDTCETIPSGSEVPPFSKTDFLIVFQTREQAIMFLENDRVLLGDGTHGITGYGYYLLTLMVLNMCGNGLCVAWGISSKENSIAISPLGPGPRACG